MRPTWSSPLAAPLETCSETQLAADISTVSRLQLGRPGKQTQGGQPVCSTQQALKAGTERLLACLGPHASPGPACPLATVPPSHPPAAPGPPSATSQGVKALHAGQLQLGARQRRPRLPLWRERHRRVGQRGVVPRCVRRRAAKHARGGADAH